MNIPDKVINRLSLYHFILEDLRGDEKYISSKKIADLLKIDNSLVRKDLKFLNFHDLGKSRVGYEVQKLKKAIEEKLGFKQVIDVFIVGAGNLGLALAKYKSFKDYGLNIVAMFDVNPRKIGTNLNGIDVFSLTKIGNLSSRLNVKFAILTVPKEVASATANYLAGAGIKNIWNFTPCILDVPKDIKVWNENLIGNFLQFTNQYNIEKEVDKKEDD